MAEVKGYLKDDFNPRILDFDYIKEHLDELDFNIICLDLKVNINGNDVTFADMENPIVSISSFFPGQILNIDLEYYTTHKDEIDEIIEYICRYKKMDYICIEDSALINEKVYEAIKDNSNIQKVVFGNKDDVVYLTLEIYNLLKDSHIKDIKVYGISPELRDNFDSIINYNNRYKIGSYTYENLIANKSFYFDKVLSNDEMYYLKYINKEAEIDLKSLNFDNYFEIVNCLKNNGFNGKITLHIEDKNSFNSYLFSHVNEVPNDSDIMIRSCGEKSFNADLLSNLEGVLNIPDITIRSYGEKSINSDLLTYLKYEKRLIEMVSPAVDLSPFEKYLFAYRLTKKYKHYQESEEDRSNSRDLYKILDNEYMVCVGFSTLLGDLLDKLGIENNDYSTSVDIGLDNIANDTIVLPNTIISSNDSKEYEVITQSANHSRREVHLVDPKYGIDGYYFTDPTWDNDMQSDTYNYALMTHDEYLGIRRYNYLSYYGIDELFFVHSLEEFYDKINVLLDKGKIGNNDEKNVIRNLISKFKKFDKEFYLELLTQFAGIDSYFYEYTKENIQDILLFIGEHILEKTNNVVLGNVFRDGIEVLYSEVDGLSGEELETKINKVMEENKIRQEKAFPIRYMIDKDGNKVPILNAYNKFDLDNISDLKVS